MDKYKKYLNEQFKGIDRDREYSNLVARVSDKIGYTGEGAAQFVYDLLENINFHSDAKETYNFLMKRIGK